MGYDMQIPAHQLGGPKKVWGMRDYGLSGLCVMRESTVVMIVSPNLRYGTSGTGKLM